LPTNLPVHPAPPLRPGALVFTAFFFFPGSPSGTPSNKGFKAREASGAALWEVPYLPIDP